MFLLNNVKYKDILDIKNLKIKEQKVTCILGESGSGKTTLLKLLNKLITNDCGEILYNNHSLHSIDSVELRRKVVMLPQIPAIFSSTIKDNLLIGLKFSERPGVSNDALYRILDLVKLPKTLDDKANNLSGGEKQRLALGRVILMAPEVLLLDEPSSALDEDTEQMLINALVDYTKSHNKTLIMVTHSKKIAHHFSDEIVRIHDGKMIDQEVYKR